MGKSFILDLFKTVQQQPDPRWDRVPLDTPAQLSSFANMLTLAEYRGMANDFFDGVVRKVAEIVVETSQAKNSLALFSAGSMPLGGDIETVQFDPQVGQAFDMESTVSPFQPFPDPATYVQYSTPNVKLMTGLSLSQYQFFASAAGGNLGAAENYLMGKMSTLGSGIAIDLEKHTKRPLELMTTDTTTAKAYVGQFKPLEVPTSAGSSSLTLLKVIEQLVMWAGSNVLFYTANGHHSTCTSADMVLLLSMDVISSLDTHTRTTLFNPSNINIPQIVPIDTFNAKGEADPNTLGILMDKRALTVKTALNEQRENENIRTLVRNYVSHNWYGIHASPSYNVCVLIGADAPVTTASTQKTFVATTSGLKTK